MVEKVARAIHNSDPDGLGALPWDELEDWQREFYISDARAAIEAMREPTEFMVRSLPERAVWQDEAAMNYRLLIAAALNESEG